MWLGKHVCARLSELHERAALVQHQPAPGDREIEPGLVLGRRGLQLEQHRPVDLLDVDTAVLDRFGRPAR